MAIITINNDDDGPARPRGSWVTEPRECVKRHYRTASARAVRSEESPLLHELQVHQVELEVQNKELAKVQADLQYSQAQYFDLYDQAPVGYLTLDRKGMVLEANSTASRLLGADKMALVERQLSDFVMPEDQAAYALYCRQLLDGRERHICELRLVGGESGKLWGRLDTVVIRDEEGGAFRLRTVINDITELKQSEERLQAIVDTAISGIITIDQRGIVRVFNKVAEAMLGFPAEEIIGHNIDRLMTSSEGKVFSPCFSPYLGKPGTVGAQREIQVQRKDGSTFLLSLGVGEFQDGNERYFTGILRDITEHKRAEQALHDSEERLALVMAASGEGFWDWNIPGNQTLHNQKWYELLGLDKSRFVSEKPEFFTTLLHEDDREEVLCRLQYALKTSGRFRSEHRLRQADGSYIWVQENGIVVKRDEAGNPLRMVGSFVDISERKHSEQQQREYHSQYERLLKLEVVNQTVAAIAHDLNQPLSAAASYADAAYCLFQAGNKQPEKLVYALEQSVQQIRRAGQFVHQLFGFLRTGETVTAPLHLNRIVRKVIATLKEDGRLREFTVVSDFAKNLPKVQANALQLEKVLINLICNGIEAMNDSGLTSGVILVTVGTAITGTDAQITVRDCGPGLDAQAAKRIFEPFYSTKTNGLGMGLAISRALIEAQGGQLWYQADDEPGAAFYLTVPFVSGTPL